MSHGSTDPVDTDTLDELNTFFDEFRPRFTDDFHDATQGTAGDDLLLVHGATASDGVLDAGTGDDLISLNHDPFSASGLYDSTLDNDQSLRFAGGEGRDVAVISLNDIGHVGFPEFLDFNPDEDEIAICDALDGGLDSITTIAGGTDDAPYVDLVLTRDDAETTIRLHGISEFDPDSIRFVEEFDQPDAQPGIPDFFDPLALSTPTTWVEAGSDEADVETQEAGGYMDLGAGDDLMDITGAAGSITVLGDGNDTLTGAVGTSGAAGSIAVDGGAGDDVIDVTHATGTLLGGEGDDMITLGTGAEVDGGAGVDSLTLVVTPDAPSDPAIVNLTDEQDSLHIAVDEDLPQGAHIRYSTVTDTFYGQTHEGTVHLNIYLSDEADPDLDALTPIATIEIGTFELRQNSDDGSFYYAYEGNLDPDISYGIPVLSQDTLSVHAA